MSDHIDSTAVEEVTPAPEQAAVVVRDSGPTLAVTPAVNAAELVTRLDVIREAMHTAMTQDVDYGVIPGTNKPALLKPGAEKLSVLFQLDVQLDNEKVWGPGEHLTVLSHATVFHAPTGSRLGYGEGICTTRERKYAKRKQERTCPTCGMAAVIKGKKEYGGGWLCWKKRDGCGATWPEGAQVIEAQEVGEIENPDLPDLWNTVVKMAEKRARVDAVLAVTGASALFTQDVEEQDTPAPAPAPVVDGVQRTGASDIPADPVEYTPPPDRLTPGQYKTIVGLFQQAAHPVEWLQARIIEYGGSDEGATAERVGALTGAQADKVEIALRERIAADKKAAKAA